jgi:hypothetical protein
VGFTLREIGDRFGVSDEYVHEIVSMIEGGNGQPMLHEHN